MENLYIVFIALSLDALLGEPPNRFHPVAWLGSYINLQLRLVPRSGAKRQLAAGAAIVMFTLISITLSLALLINFLFQFNTVMYIALSSILLKSTFSIRGLWKAVEYVRAQLVAGNVKAARNSLPALVSRDPTTLSEKQMISASIESCAENICDSFIAPLFYFMLLGVPGAVAYRIINTLDAMIGYHGRYEYTGKFAARLDDIINFVPARISGALIALTALLTGHRAEAAWSTMLKDHGKTESPNAGWTMAAMAGSLGVALEKSGHYTLGSPSHELAVTDISRSQQIMIVTAAIWDALLISIEVIKIAATKALH